MCSKCVGFQEVVKINQPYQYFDLIDQIKTVINEGDMLFVEGICKLEEIDKSEPFPADVLYHTFQCKHCGCKFSLSVEAYHGYGGSWEVLKR